MTRHPAHPRPADGAVGSRIRGAAEAGRRGEWLYGAAVRMSDGTRRDQRNAGRRRGGSRRGTRHHASRPVIPLANLVRQGVNAWSMMNGRSRRRSSDTAAEACHPLSESPNTQPCWCLGEQDTRRNAKSCGEARFFGGRIVLLGTKRANRTGQYIHRVIELERGTQAGMGPCAVRPSYRRRPNSRDF
jgi:hypothetical protein